MTRYGDRGYCSSCMKWIPKNELLKIYIKGVGREVYYCRKHRKQVRLKSRSTPMSTVKIHDDI